MAPFRSSLVVPFVLACTGAGDPSSEYRVDPGYEVVPLPLADTGFADPCDDNATWTSDEIVSPSEGVGLTVSPWVPAMIHFTDVDTVGGSVRSWLDCADVTAEMGGLLRARADIMGGGVDFLGTLDLLDLAAGEHTLVHRVESPEGEVRWVGSSFSYAPPSSLVTAQVTDSAGLPLDARIIVLQDGVPKNLASPDAKEYDPEHRDSTLTSIFAVDGVARVRLDAGNYRFVAVRSSLDTTNTIETEITGDTTLAFTIDRVVDLHGWSTGDFHLHTGASVDSFLPDEPRAHALAAAGLDMVVPADHDLVRDYDDVLDTFLGTDRAVRTIPGTEATILVADAKDSGTPSEDSGATGYTSYGHVSVFPLDPAKVTVDPYVDTTLADWLSNFRTAMSATPYAGIDDGILQLNHPRGIQMRSDVELEEIHDLFNKLGYDTSSPPGAGANVWMTEVAKDGTTLAFDFDALEVVNRGSWAVYDLTRRDWMGLLNWGRRITGTGNSDSHALAIEYAGFPMNLVPCAPPKVGGDVDTACWVDAIQQGRLSVTNGPVLDLVINYDQGAYAPGSFFTRDTGVVHAVFQVQAAPWVPVPEIRLVSNGITLQSLIVDPKDRKKDGSMDVTLNWNVPAQGRDSWVLVEAGWPIDQGYPKGEEELLGDYAIVAPGFLPVGFTNPVWIDEDGDGAWTPPAPPKKK